MTERIYIEKQEFFRALHIDELANFILDFECRYVKETTLGDLMDEIENSVFEDVAYTDDVEFEVDTLAKLLKNHDIKYRIETVE